MRSRKVHKIVGLALVLPMIGWVVTGIIFFIKPGYQQAYEQISVKTYPIERGFQLPNEPDWQEIKIVRTILGYHLLVKTKAGLLHLDPFTLTPKTLPSTSERKRLVEDAFYNNPIRYGHIVRIEQDKLTTDTEVEITLNWSRLSLRQSGTDTDLINTFYKIHYLQWTPYAGINDALGIIGLLMLITLTILGTKIWLSGRFKRRNS